MIEITSGLTGICMGADTVFPSASESGPAEPFSRFVHPLTGARVTLDFFRDSPLPPGEQVRVRYDFAGDGLREAVGVPRAIRAVTRWGQGAVYHYRLSHWIAPAVLMQFVESNVRQRTEERASAPQHTDRQSMATG